MIKRGLEKNFRGADCVLVWTQVAFMRKVTLNVQRAASFAAAAAVAGVVS